MGVCVNCGGVLEDRWKFCIFCGTPVQAAPANEPAVDAADEPDATTPEDEPGAADEPDAAAEVEPEIERDVAPGVGPGAGPGAGPDAAAEAAPEFGSGPAGRPDAVPADEREPDDREPGDAASADDPAETPEPDRPSIPAAIRTFVPVEIPNEDEDDPSTRQIRPRFRQRRVDVPLLLGIALGVAGVVLIIYITAVLSGQG